MKFILIDRVTELDPGKQLTAVKSVSLAEEYLGDHFPAFPVLPGVLLLEGMIESASADSVHGHGEGHRGQYQQL
ncbi:MAG: hypothetical protein ACYSO3_03300 [Planctomycetota bacterium]|jgi:3-hydroxyacyl-[acyl-carrier-protein] dehydratase